MTQYLCYSVKKSKHCMIYSSKQLKAYLTSIILMNPAFA